MPSKQEIDSARKDLLNFRMQQMEKKKTQQEVAQEPPARGFLGDLATGGAQAAAKTLLGVESLIEQPGKMLYEKVTGKKGQIPIGQEVYEKAKTQLTPTTTAQKIGYGAERVGEFLAPGMAPVKVATGLTKAAIGALPTAMVAGKAAIPTAVKGAVGLGARAITEAGFGAGQVAAMEGAEPKASEIAAAGGIAAAFPIVGTTLKAIGKPLAKAVAPVVSAIGERIVKVNIKPLKADIEKGFNIKNLTKYKIYGNLQDMLAKTATHLNGLYENLEGRLATAKGKRAVVDVNAVVRQTVNELSGQAQQFGQNLGVRRALKELQAEAKAVVGEKGQADLLEATNIKRGAGTKGAWLHGSPDPDADAKETVYNTFYRNIRQAIEDAGLRSGITDIKEINKKMGELIPVQSALIRRIPVAERNDIVGLLRSMGALGTIFDPKAAVLWGTHELLRSSRFGGALMRAGERMAAPAIPPTSAIGQRIFGASERIPTEAARAAGPGAAGAEMIPKGVSQTPVEAFGGFTDLSTKTLEKLKGRTTVSKQFISDLTNASDLKQAERDAIRNALEGESGTIDVKKFADKVKTELLPLERKEIGGSGYASRYENISLPSEQRGKIDNYKEHVYESPIKTSAGQVHFGNEPQNYFAHTRVEDMADGKSRRVIEVQSDLMQKGRLELETKGEGVDISKLPVSVDSPDFTAEYRKARAANLEKLSAKEKEFSKLKPYENTWHERIVREEVKQAAKDGKSVLQFPTGETAMKVEGLGTQGRDYWSPDVGGMAAPARLSADELKVGETVWERGKSEWIITEVLGDGKFKAVPKDRLATLAYPHLSETVARELTERNQEKALKSFLENSSEVGRSLQETFDIFGKVDENNPIFKFYEKEMGKYLKNRYGAMRVTDSQGVDWYQVNIKPEHAKLPVEAFAAIPAMTLPFQSKEKAAR